MYAIIETGGKQVKVEKDSVIYVEKLDVEPGAEVVFDKVILVSDNGTKIGTPYVEVPRLRQRLRSRARKRRSVSSSTSRRRVPPVAVRAIASRIQSLRLKASRADDPDSRYGNAGKDSFHRNNRTRGQRSLWTGSCLCIRQHDCIRTLQCD